MNECIVRYLRVEVVDAIEIAATIEYLIADQMRRIPDVVGGVPHAAILDDCHFRIAFAPNRGTLDAALAGSRNAAGALEAAQTGNELTALHVKQSLQGLLAAQARAETITRARDLAVEDEAPRRFKTSVGSGTGYIRSQSDEAERTRFASGASVPHPDRKDTPMRANIGPSSRSK